MTKRLSPGHIERLLDSGELARVAASCTSDLDLADALGITPNAVYQARIKLQRTGRVWPVYGRGGQVIGADRAAYTPDAAAADNFADAEGQLKHALAAVIAVSFFAWLFWPRRKPHIGHRPRTGSIR